MRFGDGLVGLRNLGNTCFLNSILQCLCKSKPLRAYFCKDDYLRDINDYSGTTKGKIAKAFAELMSEMWNLRTSTALSPGQLKVQVQRVAPRFCGYNQQDSQEFLRYLLEGVHDDLNQVKKKPTFPSIDDSKMSDREKAELYWNRYLQREKSVIQDLFVGMLKSTLTCCTCGHRSVTYDPFWDLSLPIPSRSRSSIHDVGIDQCFRSFTQEETLDGDEKPTCEKCKKRRKSTKGFLVERFPKILVLHLKRFSGLRYRTKLETMVNFPHELNLREFSANQHSSKNDPVYTLFGVSNHMGGTYGGHYTAYCRHPDTSKWHVYNDARVDSVPSSRVVSSSAYVLFYELRNAKAVL